MGVIITRISKFAMVLPVLGVLALAFLSSAMTPSAVAGNEAADTFASRCSGCHGAKAEKRFNRSMSEGQMVEIILNGKKVEKPPFMPAWSQKGVSAGQARALASYMKSLR